MRLRYSLLCALAALLLAPVASAQATSPDVVINEVDSDTPGSDAAEFVELYNSSTDAVTLDGLVVVFFNGSNDRSYAAYDLTGSLGAGDYYVLGNPGVPGVDLVIEPGSSGAIQNGADAVALYTGTAADFASGTAPTTTNLVDAVVYGTSDPDATGLLTGLGQTTQYDENANGDKDNESVQRSPDGADAFVTALATPGAANSSVAPESFSTILLGANEVPPVTTGAAGGVMAVLTGTELVVTGQFGGLESDYNTSVGSHLHRGAANANGPVEYALSPTLDADNRGGTFGADGNTFTVRPSFADSLRNGLVYVNVHTVDNPGGEIRGQLLTETPTADVTLAQARDIGAGFSVSLSGTVSRAMGDFSYVQDDDGALAVRQTFGDYSDAVAAGTIAAGTAVDLTGTLSEFNGLLQINNADLADYTVGATGAPPTPQVVTLAQLNADGEAYESRLISVVDVSFASGGGTFEAGEEYAVSQGDDMGTVRINGAEETALVGTAIPDLGQLTGVVDERNGAYRILPILATDVTASGTAGEAGPEGALSLAVANPLRGTATVRFELAAPGRARLALFDALGRQVAVLADGAVGTGEQTATVDAGRLATGVYVLRLQTERGAASRTLTVVR